MKNKLIILSKIALLFLFVSICVTSCEYETFEPEEYQLSNISFATDIQPIFTTKCAGCHPSSAGLDLSVGNAYSDINNATYINTITPDQSLIYTKVKLGASHSANYTTEEGAKVLKWIEEGAKDN